MESFFSRYKNALVLMLVVLAQVVLLAMQVRRPAPDMPDGHNVRLWRYLVAGVVTPPERLLHNIGLSVRGVWWNYLYLRHLREQNLSLQAENDRLRLEQASLAQDAFQGQQLREMLDFRGRYIDTTVPAQVIGTSGTDQAKVIYIDKGSKDGLKVQMPVITPDGIIGKVKNVFPGTAQVLLISDQTSGAGVVLQTTRIRGVMKGNASGQPQMINISPDERIQPGEPVMTSGGDQVYPPGMPVGVVERVVNDPETSYVNVVVKPNADLSKLGEVLVVTKFSDKMPFAQEKDVMQSEVDALAQKQRASDILSEKLPSIPQPEPASEDGENAPSTAEAGDPARPVQPPPPVHPDRYTPGAAPPAESLTPGAAPPNLHRDLSPEPGAPEVARTPKPSPSAAGTTANADRVAAPTNRFPPKVIPAATGTGSAVASGAAIAPGSTAAKTVQPSGEATAAGPASRVASGTALGAASASGAASVGTAARPASGANTTAAVPKPVSKAALGSTTGGSTTTSGTAAVSGATAAGGQQPAASTTTRRTAIPSESADGILTPAGMGFISATPRPTTTPAVGASTTGASGAATRPAGATPNGATATGATTTGTSTGNAGTHPAPATKPAAPKSQTNPAPTQNPPPRQSATTPPGGV